MLRILYIFCSIILLASCYEKQDGCLDIRAENYDFSADNPCEDCCSYPTMSLRIQHNWGDTLLFIDSIYTNDLNQQLQILNVQFYISEINLLSDGVRYNTKENINVVTQSGSTSSIVDDITFIQNSRLNYAIGSFEDAREFDGMSFLFGINGNFSAADESNSFVEDIEMFDETTFVHTNFKMDYVHHAVSPDTLSFNLSDIETTQELQFTGKIDLPYGLDFSIGVIVDYEALLHDIDLNVIGQEYDKFLANLSDFFHI